MWARQSIRNEDIEKQKAEKKILWITLQTKEKEASEASKKRTPGRNRGKP